MGTNFYARRILKDQEKKELHKKLDDYLSGDISSWKFLDFFDSLIDRIHLGKRSWGWQFLWQNQPNYYQNNLQSIKEFLSSGEYEIIDEHEEVFSLQEFIEEEIGKSMYSGYTHESYEKNHPKVPTSSYRDWITEDGLRFINEDFS